MKQTAQIMLRVVPASATTWIVLMISAACHGTAFPGGSDTKPSQVEVQNLDQIREYEENSTKTILELQQFRQTTSIPIASASGRTGTATLVNLNPGVNAWYVVTVSWNGLPAVSYHLENIAPNSQKLMLDAGFRSGIVIATGAERYQCNLFEPFPQSALELARTSKNIFAPLCENRLYLRNPAKGQETSLEAGVEFLRNQVWGGEKMIDIFHHLLENAHRERGKISAGASPSANQQAAAGPLSALVDPKYSNELVASGNLGILPQSPEKDGLRPGNWYPASDDPGIYISLLQPDFIEAKIFESYKSRVNSLDNVEMSSLCYSVAFDLGEYELSYVLGTENPGVEWSRHMLAQMRDPKLPGPDGIARISPLVATGLVDPMDASKTVATFTGGFKREHGAFKYGDLAEKNYGSHYGFIEQGTVFSKLQPGLATVFVLDDGQVEMKTWEESDNGVLSKIRYARQNGVALVETDNASAETMPGALVNRWGPGNWSGSEDMKLRTIRAGLALQQRNGRNYLIYSVFSDATPSAMARVFQAYQCRYAMLLDMNALEHTYLAVYRRSGSQLYIDHLIRGMSQVEKSVSGQVVPRFLGYPDNRDFFYLTRRSP